MSADEGLLYTYGLYLAHGGTPDGFMDLTLDDIQIMHTSYLGMQRANMHNILMGLGKMLNKMFGGDDE